MPRNAVSRRDPARRARALKRWVASVLVLPALFVFGIVNASSAAAQWRTNVLASMTLKSGTLARPVGVTVPGSAWFSVSVSWTPGVGTVTPSGYYVTRTSGTTTSAACGSSPTSLLTGKTCTDSWVPSGTYTYVVTAVYRTWTSASLPSGKVSVRGLFGLDFVQQPATVDTTGAMDKTVSVQLLDDKGSSATVSGVPVTITIDESTVTTTQGLDGTASPSRAVGALVMDETVADSSTGTSEVLATAKTDARGIATFEDLSVDAEPGEYVLTAEGPGLEAATSDEFTVAAATQPSPEAGSTDPGTYSVLAGSDVTSTGSTSASGDVGAKGSVKGLDAGSVSGAISAGDAATGALDAFVKDLATESGRAPDAELAATLEDATLKPGVHRTGGTLALSGTLTLDAAGDPDATFVVQATDLHAAAGTTVRLANGTRAAKVTWVVSDTVRLGAGSSFAGRIMAGGSVVLDDGSTVFGQALALGSVTLAGASMRDLGDAPVVVDPGTPTAEPQVDPSPSAEPTASVEPTASTSPSPAPTETVTPEPEQKVDEEGSKKSAPSPSAPPEPPVPAAAPEPARTPDPEPPKPVETAEPTDG